MILIDNIESLDVAELADRLDLSSLDEYGVEIARNAFITGDVDMMPFRLDLRFVWINAPLLKHRGMYEQVLLHAYTGAKGNWSHWSICCIERLFNIADRDRLRAAGNPLPSEGPFTLYRGVSGVGQRRRLRGFSWTDSVDVARWFANRFPGILKHPAVLKATVAANEVFAFINGSEREFICQPKQFERIPA
ncbi:hypothetical protein Pan44_35460 [Caulifigura coniformis]|uniref:Uncharacterized protein n=1 Tax=Caulifigura coniformis TaxID=2527983 RepID=A0A517SHB5_9PLAN|nr:hypothetical protein [Caulifigura coniformis]QDT55502.1 hypothetical protein Pan44_35460 [Caulifigura coniformis]